MLCKLSFYVMFTFGQPGQSETWETRFVTASSRRRDARKAEFVNIYYQLSPKTSNIVPMNNGAMLYLKLLGRALVEHLYK